MECKQKSVAFPGPPQMETVRTATRLLGLPDVAAEDVLSQSVSSQ